MGVTVAVVERRKDGKLWPPGGRHPEADRNRAIVAVHQMRCREGLSFRTIMAALASQYGLRVSLGSVYAYWTGYACEICQDRPAAG